MRCDSVRTGLAAALALILSSGPSAASVPEIDATVAFSDDRQGSEFGESLSLSGNQVAVGSPGAREVQILRLQNGSWVEVPGGRLEAVGGEPGDQFGATVALDGRTLVVGAPFDSSSDNFDGVVYVFESLDSAPDQWSFVQRIEPPGTFPPNVAAGRFFGRAVALSGDNLVVGSVGAAYFYRRTGQAGTPWTLELTEDKLDEVGGPAFARSVRVLDELAIVGHPEYGDKTGFQLDTGAVFVYQRDSARSGSWIEVDRLDPPSDYAEEFGEEVSLGRGTTAEAPVVIAAHLHKYFTGNREVAIFEMDPNTGGSFEFVQRLERYDPIWGLRLRMDADQLLVLGGAGPEPRGVHLFERSSDGWAQTAKFVGPDAVTTMGASLAASGGLYLAGMTGELRDVFQLSHRVFYDGFESGDLTGWNTFVP